MAIARSAVLTSFRSGCNLARMVTWRPCARFVVAFSLLALMGAPVASEAFAQRDPHACCPEAAPVESAPCQYVAPLACCAQIGVPAPTPADRLEVVRLALASPGLASEAGAPPAQFFARARNGHGPPQAAQIRTTVLRL